MYQTEIPVSRSIATDFVHFHDNHGGGNVPIIDIPAVVTILWRRRSWIIATIATVVLATLILLLVRDRTFTAATRILIEPRELHVVENDLNATGRSGGDANTAHVENQMRVLTSDKVFRLVIEREGLIGDIEFGAKPTSLLSLPKQLVRSLLGGPPKNEDLGLKALFNLRSAVSTERTDGSYVVDLFVSTLESEKSARLANAIATVYVESEIEVRSDSARRVGDNLAQRAEELRRKVLEAEQKVEAYRKENALVGVGVVGGTGSENRLLSQEQLAQMNQQLSLAKARVSQARANVDQIEKLRANGAGYSAFAEAIQSSTITQLRTRYSAAREAEASLAVTLGARHPRLAAAKAQVHDIERTITEELERIASSARGALESAQADEAELIARLENLKRTSVISNEAQVKLRELEREANAGRVVYESFLVRSREISEQENVDTSANRILSPAVTPDSADGPRSLFVLIFSAIFASGLGVVLALAREQFDDAVHTPAQVTALTGLPVLATVPDLTVDGPEASRATKGPEALLCDESLPAVVFSNRSSEGAVAFRRADGLLRNSGEKISLRAILVTSAGPTDGKSTVALNMALAAMETGERVLLVDGDTVQRTLSSVSGVPTMGAVGTTYPVVPGAGPGLDVAPASSLGVSNQMTGDARAVRSAVLRLATDFDTIIIDGSVLGTATSIAALAEAASDIVVVARSGRTRGPALSRGIQSLGSAGRKVRGCIFLEV